MSRVADVLIVVIRFFCKKKSRSDSLDFGVHLGKLYIRPVLFSIIMIKAIIFDWGSVLAPCDNKIAAIRLKKNFNFNESAFVEYFDQHEDDLCHTQEFQEFLSVASEKFNIPIESIVNALNADPPDEDFDIARKLSEHYKIYILSNQLKFRSDYIQSNFDLSFFDKVFFSNEIGLKKPSEKIFNYVLKEINQNSENCLFIDDDCVNIAAAKKLGFNAILFKNLSQLKKELASFSISID